MQILVACEESQTVTIELRKKGHDAFSCDLQKQSGGFPEWHIVGDCLPLLNGNCTFETEDGKTHEITGRWDMIIAHPPCTYLTVTGNKWFKPEYKDRFPMREKDREEAIAFFFEFVNADCDKIAIENPVGIMSTIYRRPDQYVEPFEYGHNVKKKTCLWLKGLNPLTPTEIVEPEIVTFRSGKRMSKWYCDASSLKPEERAKVRSKTFSGIAKAMAEQWTK